MKIIEMMIHIWIWDCVLFLF